MAVKYTVEEAAKIVLAAKAYTLELESERLNKQKYDKPCEKYIGAQTKGLFFLFCMDNIDLIEDDADKDVLLSRTGRWASNGVLPNSITDSEVNAYLLTEEGMRLNTALA